MAKKVKQKEYYSLRADIKLSTRKIIKDSRAKLQLLDKPNSLAQSIDFICEYFQDNYNK